MDFRTPFTKKYGFLPRNLDDHGFFRHAGKSGYTPTRPAGLNSTNFADEHAREVEELQKTFLHGFTARELQDIGAYPDPGIPFVGMSNEIQQRHHWESATNPVGSKAVLPIQAYAPCYPPGLQGDWLASNDTVWNLLQPVLRIASRILADTTALPLLDTFLCGNFEELDRADDPRSQDDILADGPLYVAWERDQTHRYDEHMQQRKTLAMSILESKIRLKIGSQDLEFDNVTRSKSLVFGITYRSGNRYYAATSVDISISHQMLQPLLRNDLIPSELLLEQFFCAITLVHETGHAIRDAISHSDPEFQDCYKFTEPFFNFDIFSEMGFALEVELFSGSHPSPLFHTRGYQLLKKRSWRDETTIQPIHTKFYHDFQTDEFWNLAVRKWGVEIIRPTSTCTLRTVDKAGNQNPLSVIRTELNWERDIRQIVNWVDPRHFLLGKTPEEISAWTVALERGRQGKIAESREAFRIKRVAAGSQLRNLIDNIRTKEFAPGDKFGTQEAQFEMAIKVLTKEIRIQGKEICIFMTELPIGNSNEPYHEKWLDYLKLINSELRGLRDQLEYAFSEATQEARDKHQQTVRDMVREMLTMFLILSQTQATMMSLPPFGNWQNVATHFGALLDVEREKRAAEVLDEDLNDPANDMELLEDKLESGITALKEDDEGMCREMGNYMVATHPWDPFMRAAGLILLSRTGKPEHRDLWKRMGRAEEEALENSGTVSDEIRQSYSDWVMEEKAAESASSMEWEPTPTTCAKRDRTPTMEEVFGEEQGREKIQKTHHET